MQALGMLPGVAHGSARPERPQALLEHTQPPPGAGARPAFTGRGSSQSRPENRWRAAHATGQPRAASPRPSG